MAATKLISPDSNQDTTIKTNASATIENNNHCAVCESVIDENMNNNPENISEVSKFYEGKNVLITGATGFLGKVLVEKLLRSCPGVENLYLLVRQKRGKDIYTRMEEIFDDPVFSRLKEEVPKFRHKVVVVPADCEAAGLGLTLTDRQMLTEKVNIVFHSAATVKFDEHLRAALVTNVRAPLHLLRLARDMKKLDVLMHISTAYSNSHLPVIEERFYPCEANCEELHQMIDKLTDEEINDMLPTVLGPWPNTYTFTKALAEKELRANAGVMPIGIFRPAIVISTAKEPLKGWLDNMYGPTGVAVGSGKLLGSFVGRVSTAERYWNKSATGILRTVQCDEQVSADIVPVDSVVNCLMVAACHVHNSYKTSSPPSEPPIFNYVSSVENRITWGDFVSHNMARLNHYPFSDAVWFISLQLTKSALLNNIYIFFLHLIPAALVDGLAVCLGRKPKMLKVYKKIHKFSSVLSYFCTREIMFHNEKTQELWEKTSAVDKKLYPFSMAEIDWNEYFDEYLAGIRRYLFKDSDDTLPQARIKWKRLYYLHQIARFIFIGLTIYVIWSTLASIW